MTTATAPHKTASDKPLTETQLRALAEMNTYMRDNQRPPTWDELAVLCGVNRTSIRQTVRRLVDRGLVINTAGGHRSLAITRPGKRALNTHHSAAL